MNKKQLICFISGCIAQLVELSNEIYRKIVPVEMLGIMNDNYELLVSAIEGLRFIVKNLNDCSFTTDVALGFVLKQLDILTPAA